MGILLIIAVFCSLPFLVVAIILLSGSRYKKRVERLRAKIDYFHESVLVPDSNCYRNPIAYLTRYYAFTEKDVFKYYKVLSTDIRDEEFLSRLERIYNVAK